MTLLTTKMKIETSIQASRELLGKPDAVKVDLADFTKLMSIKEPVTFTDVQLLDAFRVFATAEMRNDGQPRPAGTVSMDTLIKALQMYGRDTFSNDELDTLLSTIPVTNGRFDFELFVAQAFRTFALKFESNKSVER